MPSLRRSSAAGFGGFGTLRNFASVLREISFDDVRDEAETLPRLLIVGPTVAIARQLGAGLVGPEGELAITARDLLSPLPDLAPFDGAVVFDTERTGVTTRLRDRAMSSEMPLPVIRFEGLTAEEPAALDRARFALVSGAPDRAPAFGRAFPPFRSAAAKVVIDGTARANAQFALVSNVPAVIPIIGGLAAAGADFLILTKNQLMMIFKLAAIFGRDLHDQVSIFQEMIPVVGAGFVWRTIAREAASFVPFAAGTLPKVAIAYGGTVAIGRGAEAYYRTNRRPSGDQVRAWYAQATDVARRLPLSLPGQKGSKDEEAEDQRGAATSPPTELRALPSVGVPAQGLPKNEDDSVKTVIDAPHG